MSGDVKLNLDWNAIRPLGGSRASGFEELCAQLARAESPKDSIFERKGTPDAGVECYTMLSNGKEWGWQSKYFDTLGNTQWSELDDSVKTALNKHPQLVRYIVCVPLDRPDARINGRQSARQRWDAHVAKWTKWASGKGMTIEFIYWGSSELLERLKHPQHAGMVYFWFGVHGFDNDWFIDRLKEAIKTAGPRYTPEIHVTLPIVSEFNAFGRNEEFFEEVKACALDIRKELRAFEHYESKIDDRESNSLVSDIFLNVRAILKKLGTVTAQPIGDLPFSTIADQVVVTEKTIDKLERSLSDREREFDVKPQTDREAQIPPSTNPFRERRYRLASLSKVLAKTREILEHAEDAAGASLMILNGNAGTGKTHLLCDIAKQRVAAGRPTILLMGQMFVSNDAPWAQVLQQLDLVGISAGEFIGALESAAQASGCRALIIIDAINEGSGRLIWPTHIASFLTLLEKSSWIGVILSIRSSYEKIIIRKEIRDSAFCVTHHGFADHEYDATRTFFIYYGLELPSTPLLTPEFSNPLFLKTLCRGLQTKGERRLPRGFHGITAVFNLYLNAINNHLATEIGFDPRDLLVHKALEIFANNLTANGDQWLTLSKAKEIVNALMPGRDYEHSLYRGLVAEGALMEDSRWHDGVPEDDIVFIAYERFADHLIAKTLLDMHLDVKSPAVAFAPGAPLAFVCDKSSYVSPGLLESVCIQIPERIGQELISLEPKALDRWDIGDAFRQSLIWRSPTAFSQDTFKAINKLIRTQHDWDDTLDMLLTLAILPKHPLNAQFLDQRLRKDTMPDRDAWWSIYLHNAWGTKDAVDRLVDWASSMKQSSVLDDETIDLCANTLAWMFTTSNRFLRDRATKALVNLLTGRLEAVSRLVHRFNDVDDKYVTERVYAVAYGTAMRSQDPMEIGKLARCVYDHIFSNSLPPAHILLRDYARGVVERAIYLGANININEQCIRPPYKSEWPIIPSEEDIKPLLPDWSRGSYDSGDLEWARNRIGFSVMDDDFAHYVIGDNWGGLSNSWLSLRIDEPIWQSPKERLDVLLKDFSADEMIAWTGFKVAEEGLNRLFWDKRNNAIQALFKVEDTADGLLPDTVSAEDCSPELGSAEEECDFAIKKLESVLTEDHAIALESIMAAMKNEKEQQPPGFDLRLIKRYILWRVFDLGWTTARFGQFDRYYIRSYGREASKPERIGKKYQWIAYHEIMALVADHFQHRERFWQEGGDRAYEGPWQEHLRDIDPSCTLRTIPGGTSWDGHSLAWWGPIKFEDWGEPDRAREWVMNHDNLPKIEELLRVIHPQDRTRWLNVNGYFNWAQRKPADQELGDFERRELWYICTGYLIHTRDADAFMQWAKNVDFWNRWMPEASVVYRMFLGEHGWSPASRCFSDTGWTRPSHDCPVDVHVITLEYLQERGGFDCSLDDGFTLRLPASELVNGLRIRWNGNGADYLDTADQLAAFDPTAHDKGPVTLLLREDLLKEFLAREGLTLCWTILGEMQVIGAGHSPEYQYSLRMTGAYMLEDNDSDGFLSYHEDIYENGTGGKEDV